MKTVSKALVLLVAAVAAFIVSFSAIPAWAEGENIVTDPSDGMCVTHTMFTNSATSEGGINYSVDFTPITSGVDSGFSTTGHATITSVVFAPANDSADSGSSEWTRNYTKQVVLPSANAFPHAGAWMYTISETATGAAATDSTKWVNSEATYKFRVYIENDDVNGGLKYGAWSVERIDANDGTALADPEKVDATYPPTTQSGLLFSSQYIKDQTLTITKEVEGSFADKTHEFPISVKLTLPDWYHDPASADPAPSISYTDTDNVAQTGTPVYNSTTGTWELVISDGYAHSHSLTATVPVGTRYAINETNPNAAGLAYTPSVTWNVGMPPNAIYNANGGVGDVSPTRLAPGATAASANTLTAPNNKDFLCWNTSADGTGTNYLPGAELPTGSELTLYARWTDPNVTIEYMAMTATSNGAKVMIEQDTYAISDLIDVSYDSSIDGYQHTAWYTSSNKKQRKELTSSMTLREVILKWEITGKSNHWDGSASTPIVIYADQSQKLFGIHYEYNIPIVDGHEDMTDCWIGDTVALWSGELPGYGASGGAGYTCVGFKLAPDSGTLITLGSPTTSISDLVYQAIAEGAETGPVNDIDTITLYCQWEANEFVVTYDYGFDSLTETHTGYGNANGWEMLVDKTPSYTKPGYVFAGWNTEEDGTGMAINANTHYYGCVPSDSYRTKTLYAQWVAE